MSQDDLHRGQQEPNPQSQHPPEIEAILNAGKKTKAYIIVKAIVGPRCCDDAYSEVIVKILQNYHTHDGDKSLDAWVGTLARNHAIDYSKTLARRRKKERIMPSFPNIAASNISEAEHAETDKEKEYLMNLLDQWVYELPLKYREPLMLYYSKSMTFQEIADLTETSESTVRMRIHRAEAKLKDKAKKLAVYSMTLAIDYEHVAQITQQAIDKFYNTPEITEAAVGTATAATGAAAGATKASWFGLGNWSLTGIINAIGFPLFWLSSLFIGGRLAAKQIMDNAPSLYARRWIIKHFTVVYCIMLAYPVYMAIIHAMMQYVFLLHQCDRLATSIVNWTYFIGLALYLGWLGDQSSVVMNAVDTKESVDETRYTRLRRNIFNLLLFLSFLLGGVYVWLYFEMIQPNIAFLRREMQPERLWALIGLVVGMLLALWFHVKTINSFRYFFSVSDSEQTFIATRSKHPLSVGGANVPLFVVGVLTLIPGIGLTFYYFPNVVYPLAEVFILLLIWVAVYKQNQKEAANQNRRLMRTLIVVVILMVIAREIFVT